MNRDISQRIASALLLMAAATIGLGARGDGYWAPVPVSDVYTEPDYVQVAAGTTGATVFWRDVAGTEQFLLRRTTDGGTSFTTDPVLAFPPSEYPIQNCAIGFESTCSRPDQFALDGSGHVYVVAKVQGEPPALLFSRSADHGATFADPIVLFVDEVNHRRVEETQIGVDAAGRVTIVWTTDNGQIFLRRSTDEGLTFSDPIELPSLDDYPFGLRMALDDDGTVHLVWAVWPNILYTRLTTGPDGLELLPYVALPAGGTDSTDPQIGVGPGGSVNVVWHEVFAGGSRILFSRSADGGATFSAPTVVATSGFVRLPQLAMGRNGAVNVIWEERTDVARLAYFSRSLDGGATFSTAVLVVQGMRARGVYADGPKLAVDAADNVHVAWTVADSKNLWTTVVARTVGNAGTFGELQPLVGDIKRGLATNPVIAADGQGNVAVAWREDAAVFLATFSAGGTSVGQDVTVQPIDPTTGTAPVTVTFTDVTEPGETTVVTSSQGPPPDGAFKLGTPPVYYQISTTATVTFPVTVCIDYSASAFNNEANLKLGHWTGTGWEALEATLLDTVNDVICAQVMSFSTFAVLEKGYAFDGFLPPILNDGRALLNSGRTVPLKFYLRDADGNLVTNASARLSVFRLSTGIEGTIPVAVSSSGSANSGDLFRVDAATGQYVYNLSTRGLQGTYLIRVAVDDGTMHEVRVSIR